MRKQEWYFAGDYCDLATRQVVSNDDIDLAFDIIPRVDFMPLAKLMTLGEIVYGRIHD